MFLYSLFVLVSLAGTSLGQNEPISFEDFLTGRYSQRSYSGVWISGNSNYYLII